MIHNYHYNIVNTVIQYLLNIIKQHRNVLVKLNFQYSVSGIPVVQCCLAVENLVFHEIRNFNMEHQFQYDRISRSLKLEDFNEKSCAYVFDWMRKRDLNNSRKNNLFKQQYGPVIEVGGHIDHTKQTYFVAPINIRWEFDHPKTTNSHYSGVVDGGRGMLKAQYCYCTFSLQ